MDSVCEHLTKAHDVEPNTTEGCEGCLATGDRWVHLRLCLDCGHVGCCNSSPNQHAMKHAYDKGHPVIRSFEPNETWVYCFQDDLAIESLPPDTVSKDDDEYVDKTSKDSFPTSDPPSW